MEHQPVETEIARKSALIYLPISLGMALLFVVAASMVDSYPLVAKIGGAFWVGLLSLIVSMPIVTSRVKRQRRGQGS
jgi:hypothetical protein